MLIKFWANYHSEIVSAVIGAIITVILTFILNLMSSSKNGNEPKKSYDKLKSDISEALTMYCCCYRNPVDLAKLQDGKLSGIYLEGANRLRELSSKVEALAETMPKKRNNLPVTIDQLRDVHSLLMGLSNSFTTPYNCAASREDLRIVDEWEKNVRDILDIHK